MNLSVYVRLSDIINNNKQQWRKFLCFKLLIPHICSWTNLKKTLKSKFGYKTSGLTYEPGDFKIRIKCVNHWSVSFICQSAILFTGQEMILARNAIDVPGKEVMVNEELLLPIQSTFAQCTPSLHASGGAWCFTVCLYVACTNSSTVFYCVPVCRLYQ